MRALCAERGYRETTVDAVSERAAIDRERFEALFKGGKEECMVAVENAILGDTVGVVSDAYSADLSEWDSGVAGIKAILELMAAKPDHAAVGYIVVRQGAPPQVEEIYLTGVKLLVAMIDRLRHYSESEPQPPSTARAALGGAEALMRREIATEKSAELPRLLPDIVYGATVAYLGQEEALRLSRRATALLDGRP